MLPIESGTTSSVTASSPSSSPSTPLGDAEQALLAQRGAPILYFHPDERHFLQDPNTFLEQSSLRSERDFRGDDEVYGVGEVPPEALAEIGEDNKTDDSALFLDHSDETLGEGIRNGDLQNSRNLYHYAHDPDYVAPGATNGEKGAHVMTYYLFYAYNDGAPSGVGEAQNHEGDWERVSVFYDTERWQPLEVRYSSHNGSTSRSGDELQGLLEDGRPVVYVAKGSHASYPEPGQWETELGGVYDYASDDGIRFDLSTRPSTDVSQQAWYGGYAQWGERGSSSEIPGFLPVIGGANGITSGPTGPSDGKTVVGEGERHDRVSDEEMPPDPPSFTERLRELLPDYDGPVPPIPGLPDIDLPNLDPRDIDLPDVDLPNLDPRDIDLPDVDLPDLPDVDASDLDPRNLLG